MRARVVGWDSDEVVDSLLSDVLDGVDFKGMCYVVCAGGDGESSVNRVGGCVW